MKDSVHPFDPPPGLRAVGEGDRNAEFLHRPSKLGLLLAILRRVERMAQEVEGEGQRRLEFEDLTIDLERRRVEVREREVHLTAKEFDLLCQFASHPGRVYTRAQLLDLVWGYGAGSYEHTVNSHINRLRAKIEEDPSEPRFIRTVWGVGYRFFEPEIDR